MPSEQELTEIVATRIEGVLATIRRNGHPQLSNIFYLWDPDERVARISTTAVRAKARNLRRDPRAALHVPGVHFWSYAVAEGDATLSEVSTTPGDAAGRELLPVHVAVSGPQAENEFFPRMVRERRLVIRLHVSRVYGLSMERPPR